MLYSGLDATAAGEVVAELEAEGIAFEVDGAAILVDRAARDRIRMTLAAKGLPAGGPAGYEILDSLSGFGTTSQMFDAAYWRAKEGELARTITGSPDVRAARVHLANPVSQPFSRTPAGLGLGDGDHGPRRARPRPGRGDPLPRLLGGRGRHAGGGGGDGRRDAASSSPARTTARRNGPRARTRAPRRCAPTSSACSRRGSARDTPSSRSTSTPTWTARRSTSAPSTPRAGRDQLRDRGERARTPQGTNPSVTVASNLPDGDVGGDQGGTTAATPTTSRERQNFEVSETRASASSCRARSADQRRGDGRRHHDDRRRRQDRPGRRGRRRRSTRCASSCSRRSGYDAGRGDAVTISSLEFTPPAEQGSVAERGPALPRSLRRAADPARRPRRRSCWR